MQTPWWKESVVYQIYPRSFMDSNGDGIGDLRGITQKLDYLQALGVDVVWLSPVYDSPNDDNGYDIRDYRAIMDEFGTPADFDAMLEGMHARGIRLVMDLVVNHTSDEHPWFVESRKSKDNPYRDFYIWRPGRDGEPPNNWRSFFSGSAWELDPATDEYYLHLFTRKQADLNWENPQVRREVYDLMRFWVEKGVDGFRMDVINMISKAPGLPDAAVSGPGRYQFGGEHFLNGPRLLEYLDEMRRSVPGFETLLTVGETPNVTPEIAAQIAAEGRGPLSMVFQFEHMALDAGAGGETGRSAHAAWKLADLKRVMSRWQVEMEGRAWNSLYLTNHDQPRAVSRFGDDGEFRVLSAKLLAIFIHMQQGTPYIYQGEEIGMTNAPFAGIDDFRDVETLNLYREVVTDGGGDPAALLDVLRARSRDNARTPLQWSAAPQAGFTTGTPWIMVNPNYPQINAEQALADPDSIFYTYRELIRLRKQHPVIVYGRYTLLLPEHPQVYAFTRTLGEQRLLVLLNFSRAPARMDLAAELDGRPGDLLIGNYPPDAAASDPLRITLRPWEARVVWLA